MASSRLSAMDAASRMTGGRGGFAPTTLVTPSVDIEVAASAVDPRAARIVASRAARNGATGATPAPPPPPAATDGKNGEGKEADAELRALEKELAAQESRVQLLKAQLQQRKAGGGDAGLRVAAIEAKLNAEREASMKLREKMQDIRSHMRRIDDDELLLEEEMRRLEELSGAEALAFAKLKMEQVESQRKLTEKEIAARTLEIESIRQILKEREERDLASIRGHLKGTEMRDVMETLYGSVDEAVGGERATEIGLSKQADERKKMLDEVIAKRKDVRGRQTVATNDRMHRLERERAALEERRRDLLQRRAADKGGRVDGPVRETPPDAAADGAVVRAMGELKPTAERLKQLKRELARDRRYAQPKEYNGELGPQSYRPWQLGAYYMCRDIVVSIADRICDERSLRAAGLSELRDGFLGWDLGRRTLEKQIANMEINTLAAEIGREIEAEVVNEMAREVYNEIVAVTGLARRWIDAILVDAVQSIGVEVYGQKGDRAAVRGLLTRSLAEMQKMRAKRPNVFAHTQRLVPEDPDAQSRSTAVTREGTMAAAPVEEVFDGTLLRVSELSEARVANRLPSPNPRMHARRDQYYWVGVSAHMEKQDVKRARGGVSSAAVAPSGRHMAVATLAGDLHLYDCSPTREQRAPQHVGVGMKATQRTDIDASRVIEHLAWSTDGTRLVGIDDKARIHLWVVSNIRGAVNLSSGEEVQPLRPSWTLAPRDLLFAKGPFATRKVGPVTFTSGETDGASQPTERPVRALFFPSFTLLGGQHSIVACMSSGDILKLNFPGSRSFVHVPIVSVPDDARSEISLGIGAELFRGHSKPVVCVAFPGRAACMVSADEGGILLKWDYSADAVSGFGWFLPSVRAKVELAVTRYQPIGSTTTVFTDSRKTGTRLHGRTKAEIKKARADAEARLVRMQLGDPYHVAQGKGKSQEYTYAPATVGSEGADFHVVTRTADGLLSSHVTQRYVPVSHPATALLCVRASPNNNHMGFLLLFAQHRQKAPHLTIVTVSLEAMELDHVRIDVPISDADFKKYAANHNLCSIEITPVLGVSHSDYVVLCLAGSLSVYSLHSGVLVKTFESTRLPQDINVMAAPDFSALYAMGKGTSTLFSLLLADNGQPEFRRRFAHTLRVEDRRRSVVPELRAAIPPPKGNAQRIHEGWASSGRAAKHVVREILLDVLDVATGGARPTEAWRAPVAAAALSSR